MIDGSGVTVCIATIPTRQKLLRRALWSVISQTLQPDAIIVVADKHHRGACATKNDALYKVTTKWAAWLDDDDYFLPDHLATLYDAYLDDNTVDVAYAWPEMDGALDPTPDRFGQPFDPEMMRVRPYVHTTALFNARLAQESGGFSYHPAGVADDGLQRDDWGLWLGMLERGAKFVHVPKKTWVWNVNGQNTSGDPTRW